MRQAIQHAIDVPTILEAAYFGAAEPSTGIIAPGLIGHRDKGLVPPAANAGRARQLLAESGESGVSLTLDVLNKTANTTAAQVIQANLAAIGIAVEIRVHEGATFWTLGDEKGGDRWKNVQLIMNRFSMTPDPYYATAWFTTEQVGVWNWERFRDQEFDDLHVEAMQEADEQKRHQMYLRMQEIMEDTGAYIWLHHRPAHWLHANHIEPSIWTGSLIDVAGTKWVG